MQPGRTRLIFATLLAAAMTGCQAEEIRRYEVPPEKGLGPASSTSRSAEAQNGALPPGHPPIRKTNAEVPAIGSAPLQYTTPDGWKSLLLAAGSIRSASFRVVQGDEVAEVSVIPLAKAAGGALLNVNRWRDQVGLAPLATDELEETLKQIEIAGTAARYVDILSDKTGDAPRKRILAAWLLRGNKTWFFKMMGPAELVGRQTAAFEKFLHSVEFAETNPFTPDGGPDG